MQSSSSVRLRSFLQHKSSNLILKGGLGTAKHLITKGLLMELKSKITAEENNRTNPLPRR